MPPRRLGQNTGAMTPQQANLRTGRPQRTLRAMLGRFANPPLIPMLLSWTLCAMALHWCRGRYDGAMLAVQCAGFLVFAFGGFWRGPRVSETQWLRLLAWSAALPCALAAVDSKFVYVLRHRTHWAYHGMQAAAALALLSAAWRPRLRKFAVAAGILAMARVLPAIFSPLPHIDAWTLQQDAADFLLRGTNPYAAAYRQIDPPSLYGYVAHFGYLPLVLYFDALAKSVFGDVRLGYALCDWGSAWLLWRWLRGKSPLVAAAAAVLFLAQPYGPFVVEQAWSEPLVVLLALAAVTGVENTDKVAGLWTGAAIAAKQSNPLLGALLLAHGRPWRRMAWALLAVALPLLPMLAWDAGALLNSTVLAFGKMPARMDSLSLWPWLFAKWQVRIPAAAVIGALVPWAALTLWQCRQRQPLAVLAGVIGAYWTLYLLSAQSFGNYHWFVAQLVLAWLLWKWRTPGADLPAG